MPRTATDHQADLARLAVRAHQHSVVGPAQLPLRTRYITIENLADDVLRVIDDLFNLGHECLLVSGRSSHRPSECSLERHEVIAPADVRSRSPGPRSGRLHGACRPALAC